MQLEKIISISGKPGLFKLVSQLKNGFIIEDISNKKKSSISNSSQVSLLDNIAMFTFDKEVPLFEIFETVAENEKYNTTISHKVSDTELREFMSKSLPNYDTERVYVSDMKKLVQWYNLLHKSGYITKESFVKNTEENTDPVVKSDSKDKISAKITTPKADNKSKTPNTASKSGIKSTRSKKG